MIAKFIGVILVCSATSQWQAFHDLLGPKISNFAEPVGIGLAFLTLFLLFTALEKRGLLKEKYKSHDDNTFDDGSFD